MGPGDDALLSDLLDGRLDPEAEATLRRRLHEEPDLADAWDDLRRIREGLRALPGPAVPAGFSEGVRARIAGDPAEGAEGGEPQRSIAVYAVAAVLAAGLGIGAYALAIRGQSAVEVREDADVPRTTAPSFEEAPETSVSADRNVDVLMPPGGGAPAAAPAEAGVVAEKAAAPNAETPADTGASPTPRLRGPSGAVPPGLREPSDEPTSRPAPPASRGGTPGSGGGGAGGSVPALGSPPAAPTPAAPVVPTPPPPAKPSPPPRPVASDPRFQEGVDEVLTVGARDLEEGHAHLFVLLGELRATEAVVHDAREADAPAPAQEEDAKKVEADKEKSPSRDPKGGAEADPKAGSEAAATGAFDRERADGPTAPEAAPEASPAPVRAGGSPAPPSQPPPPPVLGTVLLQLTPDQLDALRARLEPQAAWRKAAASEARRAEAGAARLRVRVLVVSK